MFDKLRVRVFEGFQVDTECTRRQRLHREPAEVVLEIDFLIHLLIQSLHKKSLLVSLNWEINFAFIYRVFFIGTVSVAHVRRTAFVLKTAQLNLCSAVQFNVDN